MKRELSNNSIMIMEEFNIYYVAKEQFLNRLQEWEDVCIPRRVEQNLEYRGPMRAASDVLRGSIKSRDCLRVWTKASSREMRAAIVVGFLYCSENRSKAANEDYSSKSLGRYIR